MADQLVRIRVLGDPETVDRVAAVLRGFLTVADESPDYENRRGPGVRRYLSVLVGEERPDREVGQ